MPKMAPAAMAITMAGNMSTTPTVYTPCRGEVVVGWGGGGVGRRLCIWLCAPNMCCNYLETAPAGAVRRRRGRGAAGSPTGGVWRERCCWRDRCRCRRRWRTHGQEGREHAASGRQAVSDTQAGGCPSAPPLPSLTRKTRLPCRLFSCTHTSRPSIFWASKLSETSTMHATSTAAGATAWGNVRGCVV